MVWCGLSCSALRGCKFVWGVVDGLVPIHSVLAPVVVATVR